MAAPRTVGDHLLQRLREWEVDKVFGCAGPGLTGLLAAWDRAGNGGGGPDFVRGGHEESCAFEAVGYARLSGRLGVCAAAAGPGAIRLLNGLQEARIDHVPVLAVIGGSGGSSGTGEMDEIEEGDEGDESDYFYRPKADLPSLFRGVVGDSVQVLTAPESWPGVLDRAIRTALAERAPSVVIVPSELQSQLVPVRAYEGRTTPPTSRSDWSCVLPAEVAVLRAADVLNAGRRVAVLVGTGARGAHEEIEYVADLLGAGVAKSLHGKDVLSDDLPYVTGPIGPLGTRPSRELMSGCDTLLTIGCALPPTRYLPRAGQVRAVQIDIDARRIDTDYPTEVNLLGDAAATLRALIPHLRSKDDRTWREDVEAKVTRWWQVLNAEAMAGVGRRGGRVEGFGAEAGPGAGAGASNPAGFVVSPLNRVGHVSRMNPLNSVSRADQAADTGVTAEKAGHVESAAMNPVSSQRVLAELSARLPGNAVVAVESGDPTVWYARHLRFRGGMRGLLPGGTAAEGSAVPSGVGAKFAGPERPVIVLTSGGAMQLNGLAELITVKRNWSQWADPRLVVAVLRGADADVAVDVDFAAFAIGLGLRAITVDAPDQLGPAWEQALAADRPTLLDIRIDETNPEPGQRQLQQHRQQRLRIEHADGNAGLDALLPRQIRPFDS